MTDLSALARRVMDLQGPSREVDAEICVALQFGGPGSEGATNVRADPDWPNDILFEVGDEECCNSVPPFTASLDAAMTLVPEGWEWLRKDTSTMTVFLPPVDFNWAVHIDGTAATPALALTAAALLARGEQS